MRSAQGVPPRVTPGYAARPRKRHAWTPPTRSTGSTSPSLTIGYASRKATRPLTPSWHAWTPSTAAATLEGNGDPWLTEHAIRDACLAEHIQARTEHGLLSPTSRFWLMLAEEVGQR